MKNNKPVRDYLDTLYKKEKLNEQQYSVMKPLQEQGEAIIGLGLTATGLGIVSGAMWGGIIAGAAALVYRQVFSKAAKACSGVPGSQKEKCMSLYKMKAKVEAYKKALSLCGKSKDPVKCKKEFTGKIQAVTNTLHSK
jgi:hypothetical protein